MGSIGKLTKDDLKAFETTQDEAIKLVRHYADQYIGEKHYEELGKSCTVSVNRTIDTIIGSSNFLDGMFLMPDTVDIDKVVDWFLENRDYECNRSTLAYYMAHYLKRKINQLYREIKNGSFSCTIAIAVNKEAMKEYKKQIKIRKNQGVKIIRKWDLDKLKDSSNI